MNEKQIIGATEFVELVDFGLKIPAKIDTGADSSAIWASRIRVTPENILEFVLFSENSPHFSGEILRRSDFSVAKVRSTTGHEEIRYRTHFSVKIGGRKVKILMNLSNREKNEFPVLIGRRSISGKFIVDVSQKNVKNSLKKKIVGWSEKSRENPYEFYKKYYKKGAGK